MTEHVTVLKKETIDAIDPKDGEIYVDCTLGGGGHTAELLSRTRTARVIAIDMDPLSIARAQAHLASFGDRVTYLEGNFKDIRHVLASIGITKVHGIIADLGYNSFQLEDAGRGISFKKNEPLLMTLAGTSHKGETALDIINAENQETLEEIIRSYGEERYAWKIARAIVQAREIRPILTTDDLVAVIVEAVPFVYRRGRIHPATRTFQALRIAVNDELGVLTTFLQQAPECLAVGGRIAVITFHSLEDRIVKHSFREHSTNGTSIVLTKKPLLPSEAEVASNPRSRSAKLRVEERIVP